MLLPLFFVSACSNVGETAPGFSFKTIDGSLVNSTDLKGKIIVMNVWATWCGTCLREIPDLNRLQKKYSNDTTVVFMALCNDDKAKVQNVLNRFDFNYIQVPDASDYISRVKTRLVKTYPQNLILDDQFQIIFEATDTRMNVFETLDAQIQELKKHPTE